MTDVAVIIRLCYAPGVDEAARAWRFDHFRDAVIPRILAQDVPTDLWVWVHPRHEKEVRAMHPRLNTFTVDLESPLAVTFDNTTLRGYPWSAVQGLPRYPVQVLMGSDDLIGPRFVSAGLAELNRISSPRALVTYQPLMLEWSTGRLFAMKEWGRPSPFVMLRQQIIDDPRYTWVWADDHRKLGRLVPRVLHVPAGHAVMTVHGSNDGTRLSYAKGEIDRSTISWL